MSSQLQEDIPIGIYQTVDDISSLKIRVCIRKSVPVSAPVQEKSDILGSEEYELLNLSNRENKFDSMRIFSWQEKVSKDEKKLNADTAESSEQTEENVLLFTYVNTELSSLDNEDKTTWLTIRHVKTEKNDTTQGKKNFYSERLKTFQKPFCFKEIVQKSNRKLPSHTVGQAMAVMAILDANDSSDAEEVQLCRLTFDANGVLTVIPDFSRTPYYIRSSKSETYEFCLDHVSNAIKTCDAEHEKTFLEKVYQHHAESITNIVGSDFEMPQENMKWCCLMGELVSAENFDTGNLFVRFTFEVPSGTEVKDEESLNRITHFCKVKRKTNGNGTVAYFGSPFNLNLETDNTADPKDVKLLVEVSSIDMWNVCRNEGYGSCVLSTLPGFQSIQIRTWKLLPQSILERLRNYFVGGMPYLEDMSYVRIPTSFKDAQLSKYGMRTETSGFISIKLHVLTQSS